MTILDYYLRFVYNLEIIKSRSNLGVIE